MDDFTAQQIQEAQVYGGAIASKTVSFDATTNDDGDYDGTGNPTSLFSIVGEVLMAIIAVCETTFTGASGTLAVGVTGSTNRFLPVTTATTIVAGGTVDHTGVVSAGTAPITKPNQAGLNGQTVIATVGTADITAGKCTFYCFWVPLSQGASVTAL